jgi:hypothetical protein
MSGDETETVTARVKTVRRRPLPWLAPDITALFEAVDTYERCVADQCFKALPGNRPLERHRAGPPDDRRAAVRYLPRNWYNDEWFATHKEYDRSVLEPAEPVPIPIMVRLIPFCSVFSVANLPFIAIDQILMSYGV